MKNIRSYLFIVLVTCVSVIKLERLRPRNVRSCKNDLQPQRPQKVHFGSLDAECIKSLFQNFVEDYNKAYNCRAEEEKRQKIFTDNLKRYDRMNKMERGTAVYGVNKYSDLTAQELKDRMMTVKLDRPEDTCNNFDDSRLQNCEIPENFDWRRKGAVTPIRDQVPSHSVEIVRKLAEKFQPRLGKCLY